MVGVCQPPFDQHVYQITKYLATPETLTIRVKLQTGSDPKKSAEQPRPRAHKGPLPRNNPGKGGQHFCAQNTPPQYARQIPDFHWLTLGLTAYPRTREDHYTTTIHRRPILPTGKSVQPRRQPRRAYGSGPAPSPALSAGPTQSSHTSPTKKCGRHGHGRRPLPGQRWVGGNLFYA